MRIVREIEPVEAEEPIALTIGFFDGVHLGHRAVIKRLKQIATTAACVTFRNHPSEVLTPKKPQLLLSSVAHRVRLLEEAGVDLLYLLDFTPELSELSAKGFLMQLRQAIPFTHLILGHDAHIGKKREGTPKVIEKIAAEEHFSVEYVEPELSEGKPISSSQIRTLIKKGDLVQARELLGREVSYLGMVVEGPHKGHEVGFPTANIPIEGLILPPFGVYGVTLNGFRGVANIGRAPTLHQDRVPMIEVYLFDFDGDLYGQEVEVILKGFIREEKKFPSMEALRNQIAYDVARAREI